MRSKMPLVLMEQMIMLLVFAFSAALCLQAFARSDLLSERSRARDEAATLVQNAAEAVRYYGGVEEAAAELEQAEYQNGMFSLYYGEDMKPGSGDCYALTAEEIPSGTPGLGMARIAMEVCGDPEDVLFEVAVAWQEADGDGS